MGRGSSKASGAAISSRKAGLPVIDDSEISTAIVRHYRLEHGYEMTPRLAAALDRGETDGEYFPEEKVFNVHTPHWRELTPGEVDGEAVAYFGYGACVLLALEMHQQKGYPLVLLRTNHKTTDPEQLFVHCCVQTPKGLLLDIYGEESFEEKKQLWIDKYPDLRQEIMADAAACLKLTGSDFSIYHESELAAAHDFANLLLSELN